jgi:tetratricopeptide (TPR) repeat protein
MRLDFSQLKLWQDPRASMRELYALRERQSDEAEQLQVDCQIARCHGLLGDFREGLILLEKIKSSPGYEHEPLLQTMVNLEEGRIHNSSGHPRRAEPFFKQAYEVAQAAEIDDLAVDALHMLAIIEPDKAGDYTQQALDLCDSSAHPGCERWRGPLLNNLGWHQFEAANFEAALVTFNRALEERRKRNEPGPERIAEYCVAKTLRHLGRSDEALPIAERLTREDPNDAYFAEEAGECLQAAGRQPEAAPYFAKAYEKLSADPWHQEHEPKRLESLRSRSQPS